MDDDLRPYLREHRGIILLALAALILVAFFFFPFLDGIILGTVFAYVGRPIRDHFRERRRLGSLLAVVCIVLPIFIILGIGMLEIANQIVILAKNQEAWQSALAAVTERSIYMLPAWVKEMLAGSMENAAGIAAAIVSSIPVLHIGKVASMAIINFIVSIPVCYFTLVEGERFVESIVSLLP